MRYIVFSRSFSSHVNTPAFAASPQKIPRDLDSEEWEQVDLGATSEHISVLWVGWRVIAREFYVSPGIMEFQSICGKKARQCLVKIYVSSLSIKVSL